MQQRGPRPHVEEKGSITDSDTYERETHALGGGGLEELPFQREFRKIALEPET